MDGKSDFRRVCWDATLERAAQRLIEMALEEDLDGLGDITSRAVLPAELSAQAHLVCRQEGIIAGLPIVDLLLHRFPGKVEFERAAEDGQAVRPGQAIGQLRGDAHTILAVERTLLNMLGRLSGIATTTARFVQAVAGTGARIYDTRKTTPGWRLLEKYAVACGGGCNHRTGLFDAILIKDNHLAAVADCLQQDITAAVRQAVIQARQFLQANPQLGRVIVEVEVDNLAQLEKALRAGPDIVLLDNFPIDQLKTAVSLRNRVNAAVQLEASGGITLENVREVASTGVDRISIGALTHAAQWLDIGLDWS